GGRSRRHPPAGPGEAALPQPGADPADPRPVDRQVHGAPRVGARAAQDRTGGNRMTTITEVQTTQVYQVFVKATPEAVWDAITKPEFTSKYFHGVTIDIEPPIRRTYYNGELADEVEVLEFAPPRRLVHSWVTFYDPE